MRVIVIFLVGVVMLSSCGLEKKASKSFGLGEYQTSIDLYKKILEDEPDNALANFYVAESYQLSNRPDESLPYYERALARGLSSDSLQQRALLNYAFALKANARYDDAREALSAAIPNMEDEEFRQRAEEEYQNLQNFDRIREKESYYRVKNLEEINSNAAEYSPVYNNGELYFTSNRNDSRIYKATGTPFTSIYKVKTSGANVEMNTLSSLPSVINSENTNDGTVAFSPDGRTMVYAKGNTGKRKGGEDVDLYITRYRNNEWTDPRPLLINSKEYWDSSPVFSQDGKTLYFASNRPGGEGGTDIYSAKMNSRGRFYNVRNLGPEINTTGNEMFPYVSEDGALYFSSDGHPGFGQLDLFVARRRDGKITVENLGQPMNSSADDFGIYLFRLDRGFFTSNREGGAGDDDIYTFVNEDPDLRIVNYFLDGVTLTPGDDGELNVLSRVLVRLLDADGEVLDEELTQDDGRFSFRIYENENYNLVAERQGGEEQFLNTRAEYTTEGKAVNKDTLTDLVTTVRFDTVMVLEKIAVNKKFVLENIYYDLDEDYIRPDAARELDKLVTILKDNPELKIELSSHTDDRNTEAYNLDLSQRRARSAVEYLVSQGIEPTRLEARGYGESQLLIPNARTEEEHQVNRRTEFKILELGDGRQRSTPLEFDEDRFFDDDDQDEGNN